MAILDHDGTSYVAVKSVLDHDGATYTKIAKGFDHDGTAYTTIYSAETVLYDGGMIVQFEPATYNQNANYTYAYAEDETTRLRGRVHWNVAGDSTYKASATWRTKDLIDLAEYSTITVDAEVYTAWDSLNGVRLEFFDASNNSVGTIIIQENMKNTTTTQVWNFDISSYNTPVKVGITAYQHYSNGRAASFYLNALKLS